MIAHQQLFFFLECTKLEASDKNFNPLREESSEESSCSDREGENTVEVSMDGLQTSAQPLLSESQSDRRENEDQVTQEKVTFNRYRQDLIYHQHFPGDIPSVCINILFLFGPLLCIGKTLPICNVIFSLHLWRNICEFLLDPNLYFSANQTNCESIRGHLLLSNGCLKEQFT